MKMAFLSGMAEPAGVLVVVLIMRLSGGLSQALVAASMSAVTGVMVILSLVELMPQAVKYAGVKHSLISMTAGLAIMTLLLRGMEALGLGLEHSTV